MKIDTPLKSDEWLLTEIQCWFSQWSLYYPRLFQMTTKYFKSKNLINLIFSDKLHLNCRVLRISFVKTPFSSQWFSFNRRICEL